MYKISVEKRKEEARKKKMRGCEDEKNAKEMGGLSRC